MKKIEKQYAEYIASEEKVDELYHKIANAISVSDSVMWIFYFLWEPDAVYTQNTIAERIGIPKQTVNSAIARLAKEAYICLEQMQISGNNKRILLTEKGKAFCEKNISPIVEVEERAFACFGENEQELYLSLGIRHNQYQIEEYTKFLNIGKMGR